MKKNCLICLDPFNTGDPAQKYCSLPCSLHGKNGKRREGNRVRLLQVLIEAHGSSLLLDSGQMKTLRHFNWFKVTETTFAIGTKGYYVALTKRGYTAARQYLDLV